MTYRGIEPFKGEEGSVMWVHVSEPIMGEEALCLKNRECNLPSHTYTYCICIKVYEYYIGI